MVGGVIPWLLIRGQPPATLGWMIVAMGCFVIGSAIYFWCLWDFAMFGRGTPAPIDAPKKLVVRGLYQHVRNPMYVGVLTAILGWGLFFLSTTILLYGLGVFMLFNAFIGWYEEPHLKRTFGAEYTAYCAQVHRWIPRFRA